MPALTKVQDSGDEVIPVILVVQPFDHLPRKEWEVELDPDKTVKDLKSQVFQEYLLQPDLMKIAATKAPQDPGYRDQTRVKELSRSEDVQGSKSVYLLPIKGKEDEMLDAVLEWAYRAEVIDEYEKCGCKYTPKDGGKKAQADDDDDPERPQSRGSAKDSVLSAVTTVLSGPLGALRALRNRRVKIDKAGFEVGDGGKLEMGSPPKKIVAKMPFCMGVACLSVLNTFIVGLEADYTCWGQAPVSPPGATCTPNDRMPWYGFDCVIAVLFLVEMVIRILSIGVLDFFLGDPLVHLSGIHIPHCTDFSIVMARFIDTFILDQMGYDTNIKVISCVRIVRCADVAKLMRLVKSVRELWLVIAGIGDLMKTVMWVAILLVLIFWVVGIMMVILVGHSPPASYNYERSYWGKSAYFDTVPQAVFSLFQTMTLSQWSTIIYRPIFEQNPAIIIILVPFIMLTTVGLLNIIVGVVVDSTISSSANNAERERKEQVKTHNRVMDSLRMVFEEADTDGGGSLDKDELLKCLRRPHVRDRLKLLEIPVNDLDQLFDVIDEEKLGEIKTEHFFRGCSRLRGPALSSDLHRMSIDFGRYIAWTESLVESSTAMNDRLRSLLDDMEMVDRDIIKGDADACDPVIQVRRERSMKDAARKKKDQEWEQLQQTKRKGSKGTEGSKASRRQSLMAKTLAASMSGLGLGSDNGSEQGDQARQVRIQG